jgi:hypothetical protein
MLTNFDLKHIAKEMNLNLIGVYSKDKLPFKRVAGSYIVNLQNHNDGNGSHWVAFQIFENAKVCYFDSYGMLMPQELNSFLFPFKPIATNNRQIQDLKSDKCGYFCIAFIKYFNNFDFTDDIFEVYDDFLNCFSSNTKLNDRIVIELLKK